MSGQTAKFQIIKFVEGAIAPVDELDSESEAATMADDHNRQLIASGGSLADVYLVMRNHELVRGPNTVLR